MNGQTDSPQESTYGYDGKDRTPEQQKQFDDYQKELLDSAPDYIKQAVAAQSKQ